MRVLFMELYRLLHDRVYAACLLAAVLLGCYFPFGYGGSLDQTVLRLFDAPGCMCALLCATAAVCSFTGKDFVHRTFQYKIALGVGRIPAMTAGFFTAMAGVVPVLVLFPLSALCTAGLRYGSGWKPAEGLLLLIGDSRFWYSCLAFVLGLLAVVSVCYLITAAFRDYGRSLGGAVTYLLVTVMLSVQIRDLTHLHFLQPLAEVTPLYRLLAGIRGAAVSARAFHALLFPFLGTILFAYLFSCLVIRRAKLS